MQPDALAETQVESGLSPDKKPDAGTPAPASKTKQFSVADRMIGRQLKGQYRIDGMLGQGAMGVVFRGTQLALDKPVAVKMLRPDGFHGDDALDRFAREATLCSKLVHPSIAQVLDFGIEDGMPFLVMEFVDGKELTEVLEKEGPMAPSRAIAVIRQLASALEEAHKHGVVHRDIKPHNLRLMRYTPGGQLFLKVLDFGIAKQLSDGTQGAGEQKLTATGAVMGTPAYMPPEQAGGQKIDARADQYATGIVLYELLTGIVPFTGETITGVLMSHMTRPPPPLPREVPEPLRKVVMRLLEKNAEDRYPNAATLDLALAGCEPACRDVPPLNVGKVQPFIAGAQQRKEEADKQKTSALIIGGSAVLLSLLVLGGVLYVGLNRQRHPKPEPTTTPVAVVTSPTAGGTSVPEPVKEVKPEPVKEVKVEPPPPLKETKPELAQKIEPVQKPKETKVEPPSHPASPGAAVAEPPEIKEQLNEAEQLIAKESYQEGLDLLRRTTFTSPTARAYRLMVKAYCNMGNLEGAKTAFRRTTAADRKALIGLCKKHDIDLP